MGSKAGCMREVVLAEAPMDVVGLMARRARDTRNGAVVHFHGIVRGDEAGRAIWGLEYTSFERMALRQFDLLIDRAAASWPVESVRVHHRLGRVRAGEASLWVEVAAPHRAEAFEACRWLIDEMKRVVPIWKRALQDDPGGPDGVTG